MIKQEPHDRSVLLLFRKSRSNGAEKKHVVVERFARILIAVMFIAFNGYGIII